MNRTDYQEKDVLSPKALVNQLSSHSKSPNKDIEAVTLILTDKSDCNPSSRQSPKRKKQSQDESNGKRRDSSNLRELSNTRTAFMRDAEGKV